MISIGIDCRRFRKPLANENGSILFLVMLLLVILALAGTMATRSSTTELVVAVNDKAYRIAFNAAESGLANVVATPAYYGSSNVDVASPVSASVQPADSLLDFDLSVAYQGVTEGKNVLRGTGFSAGKFRAHEYMADSIGKGPSQADVTVRARFYRLGF